MEAVIMYWKENNVLISNKWMSWSQQVVGRLHLNIANHVSCLVNLNHIV